MKRTHILFLALLVCLSAVSFGWGYDRGKRSAKRSVEVVVRDTTIIDTVFREVPKVIASRVVDTMIVHVPVYQRDTVILRDSVDVVLPVEQKEYGDETYHAWVSGFRPRLDSILVFSSVEVRTVESVRTRRARWGLGVQAGYGAYAAGSGVHLAPYVGVGVSYNILSWDFGKDRP